MKNTPTDPLTQFQEIPKDNVTDETVDADKDDSLHVTLSDS